jgi:DNA-binding transcriptional ArsR family regulator
MEVTSCKTLDPQLKRKIQLFINGSEKIKKMEEVVLMAKALSDINRIRVFYALRITEMCVCEIADVLSMPQSTISGCLKELYRSGLLIKRRSGKWIYYSTNLKKEKLVEVLENEIQ